MIDDENPGNSEKVGGAPKDGIISHPVTIPTSVDPLKRVVATPATILSNEDLLRRVVALYDDDDYYSEKRERKREVVAALVTTVGSEKGGIIARFFLTYGASTQEELRRHAKANKATVSRTLDRLLDCDVIKVVGKVLSPYRNRGPPGPDVIIYALNRALPELAQEAQERWAELRARRDPSLVQRRHQVSSESARQATIDEWAIKVEELLPMNLEGKLGPIYEAIKETGVPLALVPEVKDRVISMRIQGKPRA